MTIPTITYICPNIHLLLLSPSLNKVQSLKDLIDSLLSGEYAEIVDQIEELMITKEELQPYLFWNDDHYTRNCIVRTDDFELLALCWEEGQTTHVHSHDNQECWVMVIEGSFQERIYLSKQECLAMEEDSVRILSKHDASGIEEESTFHSLENAGSGRAISLHLYMKPIDQCDYLCPDEGIIKSADLDYYSYAGKRV